MWMSALLNGFGKNTLDHIRYNAFVENEKDFVSKSVQELTPSSSRKTQAHKPEDRIAKLLFLKNKEQNRGIKPDFATSSTKCPATDLEKHPGEQHHRHFIHTEMSDVPHGINTGMLLVKYN